ncbi:MAG: hypothetical protein P8J87_01285 [Verrucomicrobiales bacterium]|nr:hypothetical protein [Verrucomicrobiales bacterium]
MSTGANVKSVENLDYFRSCLSIYITKARRSLDEVMHEVSVTRQWLQHDQRVYWQAQYKKRKRKLDQLKAELLSAKLSSYKDSVMVEEMAVAKATEQLREAEQKLMLIKKWIMVFDSKVETLAKRIDSLRFTVTEDLPKAVHTMSKVIKTLEAYAEKTPGASGSEKRAGEAGESADGGIGEGGADE